MPGKRGCLSLPLRVEWLLAVLYKKRKLGCYHLPGGSLASLRLESPGMSCLDDTWILVYSFDSKPATWPVPMQTSLITNWQLAAHLMYCPSHCPFQSLLIELCLPLTCWEQRAQVLGSAGQWPACLHGLLRVISVSRILSLVQDI